MAKTLGYCDQFFTVELFDAIDIAKSPMGFPWDLLGNDPTMKNGSANIPGRLMDAKSLVKKRGFCIASTTSKTGMFHQTFQVPKMEVLTY